MNTQHDITVSGKPLNPPKPPAKPHMLLWIDTETTGLDPNQCELLEVGMQVTDLKAETRGGSLHLIVHPDNVRNWTMHPEMLKAYEMHLANGLMLACAEAPKTGYDYKHTALNIHEFLNDQLSQYTLHPAGTNVDFDLRQLDVHLGRHLEHPITQGLHHRKLDLTSFRLADQAIGGNPYQNHAGTHRVQDCIRRDINDYTAYLDIIRTGTPRRPGNELDQRPRQQPEALHRLTPRHGMHRPDRRHHLLPWELLQVPVALPQQGPALGRPRKSPMVPMPSHRLRRKDRVDAH